MKFEEAFDLVFDDMRQRSEVKGEKFSVNPPTAKILAFFWNMLAVSIKDDQIRLDDLAYLSDYHDIISIPLKKDKKAPKDKKDKKDK